MLILADFKADDFSKMFLTDLDPKEYELIDLIKLKIAKIKPKNKSQYG